MEDVLRIHDAPAQAREVRSLGVRAHHRVAEQDQHERGRHHDAERARDANQGDVAVLGKSLGGEAGVESSRQHRHAGAGGTAHGREQHAEEDPRERQSAPRGLERAARRAKENVGEGGAVDDHAHQHVKGQRLQQVVLEEADQARVHGLEERGVEESHGDASRGEGERDSHEDDPRRQSRGEHREGDGREHPQARRLHHSRDRWPGAKRSTSAWRSARSARTIAARRTMK